MGVVQKPVAEPVGKSDGKPEVKPEVNPEVKTDMSDEDIAKKCEDINNYAQTVLPYTRDEDKMAVIASIMKMFAEAFDKVPFHADIVPFAMGNLDAHITLFVYNKKRLRMSLLTKDDYDAMRVTERALQECNM